MTRLLLWHEDDSLLAVEKPSGLPVHGSGEGEETVETVLRRQLGAASVRAGFKLSAVHRLDRDTSGVLLLARRKRACRRLMEQFASGTVAKEYLALVLRGPEGAAGVVDKPLRDLARGAQVLQEARTEWRVVVRGAEASLVACRPLTGRTHQIRRHMAAIGCPLAGDLRYGSERFNGHAAERWGLERMFLHAHRLGFDHPDTSERITLVSPLPERLQQVIDRASTGA